MPELLMPYDPAHAMTDPQAVAIFLTDALQTGDAGYVGKVLGMAAHAKGMGVIAEATGFTHDQLEGFFSAGDTLRLDALLVIVHALGVKLTVCPSMLMSLHAVAKYLADALSVAPADAVAWPPCRRGPTSAAR